MSKPDFPPVRHPDPGITPSDFPLEEEPKKPAVPKVTPEAFKPRPEPIPTTGRTPFELENDTSELESLRAENRRLTAMLKGVQEPKGFVQRWLSRIFGRIRAKTHENAVGQIMLKVDELHREIEFRELYEQAVAHNGRLREELNAVNRNLTVQKGFLAERNKLLRDIYRTNRLLTIASAFSALVSTKDREEFHRLVAELEMLQQQVTNSIQTQPQFQFQIQPEGIIPHDPRQAGTVEQAAAELPESKPQPQPQPKPPKAVEPKPPKAAVEETVEGTEIAVETPSPQIKRVAGSGKRKARRRSKSTGAA